MNVHVEDSVSEELTDIYYYNALYSLKNAIETDVNLRGYIHDLEYYPYLGRYIPEMEDKRFRESIYRRNRYSGYRIMYYISESSDTIYIIGIINCKQDFSKYLKCHGYFKKYYNL